MFHTIYATERTRAQAEGRPEDASIMMRNRKPYRTKSQKAQARSNAVKVKTGQYVSDAPRSFHPAPKTSG